MHPLPRTVVAGLALLGLLAGCQANAAEPVPAPTFRCTPEAGGPEFDCSRQQHDRMLARDARYAEAEAVYRKFFREDVRILRSGGVEKPTRAILETTTGAFLQDSMAYYRELSAARRRLVGGRIELASLSRLPGVAKGGSTLALEVCIDATSTRVFEGSRRVGRGASGVDKVYFGEADRHLVIQGADGEERQCPPR